VSADISSPDSCSVSLDRHGRDRGRESITDVRNYIIPTSYEFGVLQLLPWPALQNNDFARGPSALNICCGLGSSD
jgi:hypothetical protein